MEGDRVLVFLADVIRNNLRHTDTGFRYGGEEFTVLLPQTRLEDVMTAAERLRESFANTPLSPLPGVSARLTISVGAGQYIHGEMEDKFVKRIDSAMYRAKKGGKNQVSFAD
jgi:diguanylate cyclase (GGDEF)-like protein